MDFDLSIGLRGTSQLPEVGDNVLVRNCEGLVENSQAIVEFWNRFYSHSE